MYMLLMYARDRMGGGGGRDSREKIYQGKKQLAWLDCIGLDKIKLFLFFSFSLIIVIQWNWSVEL